MTALSKSNATLISHILQIHSGTTTELDSDSCFDLYCDVRTDLVLLLFNQELEHILAKEDSFESRVEFDSNVEIRFARVCYCSLMYVRWRMSSICPSSTLLKTLLLRKSNRPFEHLLSSIIASGNHIWRSHH